MPGRRISRPSDDDFHIYATNGAKDKMKEALRQYPDLVDVVDAVSTTGYGRRILISRTVCDFSLM